MHWRSIALLSFLLASPLLTFLASSPVAQAATGVRFVGTSTPHPGEACLNVVDWDAPTPPGTRFVCLSLDRLTELYCDGGSIDWDRDGYDADEDCNDNNADVHPGATDDCTNPGVDNDCDGETDEDATALPYYYLDADGDGSGNPDEESYGECEAPDGYVYIDGDCDDTDASINPGADEIPDNGIDEDCDGEDL